MYLISGYVGRGVRLGSETSSGAGGVAGNLGIRNENVSREPGELEGRKSNKVDDICIFNMEIHHMRNGG